MGRIGKAVVVFAFFVLLSFPMGAAAQMGGGQCASDIQKFCKDIPRGQGRIALCLKSHQAELSDGCKQEMGQKRAARESQSKEACAEDLAKFCKDVSLERAGWYVV